ncbi:MAG: hypothetical protein JNK11_16360 [Alphaproteobacteria bacterium]|nr:hypothetical protein [Alphaproteobacteria bacterium]
MAGLLATAADAGYFDLLEDMHASLAAAAPGHGLALGVLDLGLTSEQRQLLEARGVAVVAPDWPLDFPGRARMPRTYLAQLARPYLPRWFPGHSPLVWIDADCWLQDGQVLQWLRLGSAGGRLAIAQELDRAYGRHYDVHELWGKHAVFRKHFGEAAAQRWGLAPSLNVGLFALEAGAPHWAAWAEDMARILAVDTPGWAEQAALDHAVLSRGLPVTWLPARANWVCHHGLPAYCPARRRFVEPLPPFDPLWVLHLTLEVKRREVPVMRLDGQRLTTSLRWSAVRGLLA